jgi:hypothetical protein
MPLRVSRPSARIDWLSRSCLVPLAFASIYSQLLPRRMIAENDRLHALLVNKLFHSVDSCL